MDTKLKKMTANIKGIKGWFTLTVFGLDVLLGIAGGNLISSFYGDVIIYVGFLVTVAAGIHYFGWRFLLSPVQWLLLPGLPVYMSPGAGPILQSQD